MDYLDQLLERLISEYGNQITQMAAVQPENESFQGFDQQGWRVSSEYMRNLVHELNRRLPDVPIIVTSAGRPALNEICDLFSELLQDRARFPAGLVSGFDYYYSTPRHNQIPFHRYLDPIALAFDLPSAKTCADNLRDARAIGFGIEVSEAQAEPYAHVTGPGNSAQDYRFMLLRCAAKVLDPLQTSILRIWGVEEMAKKALSGQTNDQHQAIFDLTRRLTRISD
jgi:hypothetical protein